MASPTSKYHPGRVLAAFLAGVVLLAVWALWPGQTNTPQLGLDLQGGTQVTLLPQPSANGDGTITTEQLDQAVAIIRQRVDGLGVAESEVAVQGSGSNAAIVISVPGSVEQDRLVELVGRTAQLAFRPVEAIADPGGVDPTATDQPSDSASPSPTATKITPTPTDAASPSAQATDSAEANPSAEPSVSASPSPTATVEQPKIPVQAAAYDTDFEDRALRLDCTLPENRAGEQDDQTLWLATCDRDGTLKYILQPSFIQGTSITNAQAQLDAQTNSWSVSLTFDSEGSKALATVSTDLYDNDSPKNQFAIVLDSIVYSSPYFSEPITGGSAQITGSFTSAEAADLANVLKFGSLPISLEVGQVTSITPTVGLNYLHAGLLAGAIGLILVAIFLLAYYRALGIVAVASLLIAGVISYLLFVVFGRQLGFTLTLAGIAGAIVAIGVTADSFIVYFERFRDEIREGHTLRVAADIGWLRARRTLLAADFVSLLGAIVLYVLSIGSVRGFAFTLGVTTVVDVLVAFLFTRPVVALLAGTRWFQRGSKWTGVNPERLGVKPRPTPQSAATAGRQ